ncbi:hypothetical protein BGZ82_003151 [Podila clonocystis]|nr:hypothetical protein BGZ82_003151 [Podila clonocystis]
MSDPKNGARSWAIQSLADFIRTAMYLYMAVGGADAVTRGQALPGPGAAAWAKPSPSASPSSSPPGPSSASRAHTSTQPSRCRAMLGVALARGTTPSNELIGQVNVLMNGESIARGFFLEFFLTAILCFVYHMTVHEKNRSTFMAALPYGLAIFSCHLFATRYTNAAINPARAFATSVAARKFAPEHWIFWFGPFCGAILAAALHILFRFLDFDTVNAGIDAENQAQYMRAQAAVENAHRSGSLRNANGTTTTTTTTTHANHAH